jgi:LPS-assembly lipoprotein
VRSIARRSVLLAGPSAVLAGCGFELRRGAELTFGSIALTGFAPRSPMEHELRRALARIVRVEDVPARADVVLQALADARERVVVATTAAAQVRELQLRVRLRYRTHTPAGRELTPPAELLLARDLSYSETVALAKAYEEADLFREMQSDIVGQVLRRLAAIRV